METLQKWLINSSEDFQFILFFGMLGLLIVLEHRFHFRKPRRRKRWVANFVITLIAIVSMTAIPISFISAAKYAQDESLGLLNIFTLNTPAVIVCTLLVRSFISFFTHYLTHRIPIFWRVHRVHHLDTEIDVSTNVRFHPFEFLINIIIGVPIVVLFGLPVWVLMLYELLDIIVTLVSHTNISFPEKIEKYLRYIVVTPDLHRIHHSSFQPETDSNFGAVFPIWDIVFGTFRTDTKDPMNEMEIGLEEVRDARTNSILWLLASPFKNFRKNK